MLKAYEKKTPVSKEMRHRAIVWSCPANYYTNFAAWLETAGASTSLWIWKR